MSIDRMTQPRPREAALFEAPPTMERNIRTWAQAAYAGHILAGVLPEIARAQDATAPIKEALAILHNSLQTYGERIHGLEPGEDVKIHIPVVQEQGVTTVYLGVIRNKYNSSRPYNIGKGPNPRSIKYNSHGWDGSEVDEEVLQYLNQAALQAERVLGKLQRAPTDNGPTLVELQLLRRECLKYTLKPKAYATKATTSVPVDLTGWKYVQDVGPAMKTLSENGWGTIYVILDFKGHIARSGLWDKNKRELQIDAALNTARTVDNFNRGLAFIAETARHEVQHIGQDLLRVISGLREEAGLPSKSIRDPSISPNGIHTKTNRPVDHALIDVEFYTDLSGEVDEFMRQVRHIPIESRRNAVRVFVGFIGESAPVPLQTSTAFAVWKKGSPVKWKKAVAEFIKAIEERGVNLGRGGGLSRIAHRVATKYLCTIVGVS